MSSQIVAGRYRLGRRIGAGGMGRVWLARDEVLRRPVAVKEVILPDGLAESEAHELRQRTLREAQAAARLSHPNVVKVYDVLQTDNRPWIVMEYIPSRSLAQVIKEDGALPPARVAAVGLSVLAALCAAHDAGVLHRDVKPGNVLLADDGRVVLTDFGLATFDEVGAALTQSGIVHGSPQFIAPERALDGTSSVAADMWSLGATLYAAVEGRSPYARGSSYAVLTALATAPPDPPQRAGALKPVLSGLLRRNPAARMPADEVKQRLYRIVSPEPGRGRLIPKQRRLEDSGTLENVASPSHAAPRKVSPLRPTPRRRDTADGPAPPAFDAHAASGAPPRPVTPLPRRNRRAFDSGRLPWSRKVPADAQPSPARATAGPAGTFMPEAPGVIPADIDREMDRIWADGSADVVSGIATPHLPLARPTRDRRRFRPALVVAVVVAVLSATAAWAVAQTGGNHGPSAGAVSAPPSTSASPSSAPVPTAVAWPCPPTRPADTFPLPASITSRKFAPLDGWKLIADPAGRPVGVRDDWRMTGVDGTWCMYDPQSSRLEGINHLRPDAPDAGAMLRAQEKQVAASLVDYHSSGMAYFVGLPNIMTWEFTFKSQGVPMHAVVRGAINHDGTADEVWWQTTEIDWGTTQGQRDGLLSWFTVAHSPAFDNGG